MDGLTCKLDNYFTSMARRRESCNINETKCTVQIEEEALGVKLNIFKKFH
jgi:hypothetical protein